MDEHDNREWIPSSTSSDVSAFRYDHTAQTLDIRFKRLNREYRFHDVPLQIYDEFFAASSKGKFVHEVLYFFASNPI